MDDPNAQPEVSLARIIEKILNAPNVAKPDSLPSREDQRAFLIYANPQLHESNALDRQSGNTPLE